MKQDHSLTPEEVAMLLKIKKNTVYELIKRGELKAYRIGRKLRIDIEDVEAYKNLGKGISPQGSPESPSPSQPLFKSQRFDDLIICGQDILLDVLTRYLESPPYGYRALRQQVGSMAGLQALYHEQANVATAHLWDGVLDEYNISYVRYLVPGMPKLLINLVYRVQGFYVAAGNPLQILTWQDLVRSDVHFVNREKGSGTRVLLDEKMRIHHIDSRHIQGYDRVKMSHLEIASAVARGEADVGLGTQKAALQVRGIEFVPLQKERYDMVLLKSHLEDDRMQAVIDIVQSRSFANDIRAFGDYDVSDMGKIHEVI